jgi:hypothetical protein
MNSYFVRTETNIYCGEIHKNCIIKADSVKEAILKQIERMDLENENGINVSFDVTLMEVVE